jgi:DNA-binding NtrC family response regulator
MLHFQRPPAKAMHTAPPHSVRGGPILLDPAMTHLYGLLDLIAPTTLPVVIHGETGCGKELFAEAIQKRSGRSAKPFLCVNCASLSGSLLESELFGHEKGAFTGAIQAREGIFEAADGGTLFLDEIGELPIETQAKLLRVLENGEVLRLGSVRTRKVDVRFISATNRDLHAAAAAGTFRRDLLFRLNGFAVTIPPLRARVVEIVPLAKHFLARAAKARQVPVPEIGSGAARALERHPWPGNVRELRLTVERALAIARGGIIHEDALMLTMAPAATSSLAMTSDEPLPPLGGSLRASRGEHEKARVIQALEKNAGNQTAAARALGVSRRTLITKMEVYGLARPRKG